jgi:hypothetical protein
MAEEENCQKIEQNKELMKSQSDSSSCPEYRYFKIGLAGERECARKLKRIIQY